MRIAAPLQNLGMQRTDRADQTRNQIDF